MSSAVARKLTSRQRRATLTAMSRTSLFRSLPRGTYTVRCREATGRPSIDPQLMIRMLVIGYCFGVRSERRLCDEVHLNLAYRWFCCLDLQRRSDGSASTLPGPISVSEGIHLHRLHVRQGEFCEGHEHLASARVERCTRFARRERRTLEATAKGRRIVPHSCRSQVGEGPQDERAQSRGGQAGKAVCSDPFQQAALCQSDCEEVV